MQVKQQGTLTGIKRSKGSGNIEGEKREWDSTTFFIMTELPTKGDNARGQATQDFRFGKSDEFEKWTKVPFPVVVDIELAITTNGKNGQSTEVLSITPSPKQPARIAA